MSAVNEALVRYIGRLEDENRALTRRVQELTPNEGVSVDIKKALHDASNELGIEPAYRITDPDAVAVKWIQEVVQYLESKR